MVAEQPHRSGAKKQRRPNGQYQSLLNGEDAIKTFGAQTVRRELKRLNKLKARVRAVACSEAWVDDNWERGEPYPPGGDETLMVRCAHEDGNGNVCGRIVPPNSLEGGVCMDHQCEHLHAAYGSSPSAAAIREVQYRNLRLESVKLRPSAKSDLRREIKRFEQTGKISNG